MSIVVKWPLRQNLWVNKPLNLSNVLQIKAFLRHNRVNYLSIRMEMLLQTAAEK